MLNPRWRKVAQDLVRNRVRTLMVVLSIAVGVFAIGAITGTRTVFLRELTEQYPLSHPHSAMLVTQPVDPSFLEEVRRIEGVQEADGRGVVQAQVEVGPNQWKSLVLYAIPDFANIRVDKIVPNSGAWPPSGHEVLIERASLPVLDAHVGGTLRIQLANGAEQSLRVSGSAYEMNLPPVAFSNTAYAYITMETLAALGEPVKLSQINLVAEQPLNKTYIQTVADRVRDRLYAAGWQVGYIEVPEPAKHPADDAIKALMLILGVMGGLTLVLSGFLVVNSIGALLAEQVRQIGIMKTIGARQRQIVGLYLVLAGVYGGIALIIGVPLGAFGAWYFVKFIAGYLNLQASGLSLPLSVLALQVLVGLLLPPAVAAVPVLAGTRLTVREALISHGGQATDGERGLLDRSLSRLEHLSRPVVLSIRNTFRRRMRLARTVLTISLAGAMFIAVLSLRSALISAVDDAVKYQNYDVEMSFAGLYHEPAVKEDLAMVPGVMATEVWRGGSAAIKRPDGAVSPDYSLIALPDNSNFVIPSVVEGMWLKPGDETGVVVSSVLLKDERDLHAGSSVTLKVSGKETTWQVVGVVRGALDSRVIYVNQSAYARSANDGDMVATIRIRTAKHDAASQQEMAGLIRREMAARGYKVAVVRTTAEYESQVTSQFDILVGLLLGMSMLMALVGGLGLMGTMTINVSERAREIGIMRALGSTNGSTMRVVMVEGLIIGMISWPISVLVSLPLSWFLGVGVGSAFLSAPLPFHFSVVGAFIWLCLVFLLAALGGLVPARRALRLSVREVLAYE